MLRKDVKEIKEKIEGLSEEYYIKAQKYDELLADLRHVKIGVDKCIACFDEERLSYIVKVTYSIPPVNLILDENGEALLDPRFKAMNELGFITLSDMNRIGKELEKAMELNNKGN